MNTLDLTLQRRGLLDAARTMHWQTDGAGWRYPVFDRSGAIITHRWKNADSAALAGNKYRWSPTKGSARYYHAPDLCQAVQAAGGVLYIANGEPSVLAYLAAGVRNVLSWYGEGSVPASLLDDLRAMQVTRVIYAPDRDRTGAASAAKVRDVVAGSGIDFEALALPDTLPDKSDFNDLWIACDFDELRARTLLDSLAPLALPAPKAAPATVDYQPVDDTPAELIRAVAARLGIVAFKANGWSRENIISPFRDEQRPSAGLNCKSGVLYDFASGQSYSLKEVAAQIGIDWRSFYPERPKPARRKLSREVVSSRDSNLSTLVDILADSPRAKMGTTVLKLSIVQRDESPAWYYAVPGGMPNSWRSLALARVDAGATFFVERLVLAITAGNLSPDDFTAAQAASATGISKSQVNRHLARLLEHNLFIEIYEPTHKTDEVDTLENAYSGFARRYRLQSINHCRAQLQQAAAKLSEEQFLSSDRVLPSLRRAMRDEELDLAASDIRPVEAAFEALRTDGDRRAERLHRLDVVRWERELNDLRHTSLELETVSSSSDDYRPALLKRYLAQQPADTRHHRRDTSRYLGCKESALPGIYKAAGLQAVAQWESVELDVIASPGNLQKQYAAAQKRTRGKVIHINGAATYKGSLADPAFVEELQAAQARGEVLTLELRVPSLLVEVTQDAVDFAPENRPETPQDAPTQEQAFDTPETPQRATGREIVPEAWQTFAGRKVRVALHRLGFNVSAIGDIIDVIDHQPVLHSASLTDGLRLVLAQMGTAAQGAA